jgi:CMP-N,N'-diacetyllegionaminic acid synthase
MNTLITICARGGSKGIAGKNIRFLNGKPLIAYTIELVQKIATQLNAKVALSTDSEEIKLVASQYDLHTKYLRPSVLASDTAGKIETINDVLNYEESLSNIKFDYILDLDVTSPLRTIKDVLDAFEIISTDKEAISLFSVNDGARNPYFNMVEKQDSGYYNLIKFTKDELIPKSRQTSPKVFDLNASFYWYKRSFFDVKRDSAITEKSLIYKMEHICFDLDYEIDFLFMEFLLKNNKLDFNL